MFPEISAFDSAGAYNWKSIAPTASWPILTKRSGELATTLLSMVMTMTTMNTVKIPILKALIFFDCSWIKYYVMTLKVLKTFLSCF